MQKRNALIFKTNKGFCDRKKRKKLKYVGPRHIFQFHAHRLYNWAKKQFYNFSCAYILGHMWFVYKGSNTNTPKHWKSWNNLYKHFLLFID